MDFGAPMVYYDARRGPVIHGLAEAIAGGKCASGEPDGFTRVARLLEWIKEHFSEKQMVK